MKKKWMIVFVALCAFAVALKAQERTITGKVTSAEDGTPLPGVNVAVKDTKQRTVTGNNGKYSINIPVKGGTLVFTFVGYTTQEIAIGRESVTDVSMSTAVKEPHEVVVRQNMMPFMKIFFMKRYKILYLHSP